MFRKCAKCTELDTEQVYENSIAEKLTNINGMSVKELNKTKSEEIKEIEQSRLSEPKATNEKRKRMEAKVRLQQEKHLNKKMLQAIWEGFTENTSMNELKRKLS